MSERFVRFWLRVIPAFAGLTFISFLGSGPAGCVDLSPWFPGPGGTPNGGGQGNGNGNGGGEASLQVRLAVSNPTPSLNEQVVLTCSLVGDDPSGGDPSRRITFEFAPDRGRLVVDAASGVARFVVTESDLNVATAFTCRAVADGTERGPVSNQVVVIATALPGDNPLEP